MAVTNFMDGGKQICDASGNPLAAGLVNFYDAGTSVRKNSYTTSALTTANANPVVLDANGRANIWLSGPYKVVVTDSNSVTIFTEDNINPNQSTDSGSSGNNIVENGSFESAAPGTWAADGDEEPLNWLLTKLGAAADQGRFILDTPTANEQQRHGLASLKFTSTASVGGGSAVSKNFLAVGELQKYRIGFDLYSSGASLNKVQVTWYEADQATSISTTDVYSVTGAVTTWTRYEYVVTPPAASRFCKITLSGATTAVASTIYFDNVTMEAVSGIYSTAGAAAAGSSGAIIAGARLVGAMEAQSTGGTVVYYAGICSSQATGGTGVSDVTLSRALATNHTILVSIRTVAADSLCANAVYNAGSPNKIQVRTFNLAVTLATFYFHLQIWEYD